MKKRLLIWGIILSSVVLFFNACDYQWVVYPEPVPPDPTDTISFSQEIIPIFTTNDYCTSCHKTGGTAPDLTEPNAYNSIVNGGLVDLENPMNSIIYDYPRPQSSTHNWKKYTLEESDLVLGWVDQGALDN